MMMRDRAMLMFDVRVAGLATLRLLIRAISALVLKLTHVAVRLDALIALQLYMPAPAGVDSHLSWLVPTGQLLFPYKARQAVPLAGSRSC